MRKLMMVGAVLAAASCFAGKISVEGRGTYSVAPDTMEFSFSVLALDKDMMKSLALFGEKNALVIKSLQDAGVPTNVIVVSDIEMVPKSHYEDKDGEETSRWADGRNKKVFDGYEHSAEYSITEPLDRKRLNAIYKAIVSTKVCEDVKLVFILKDEKPAYAEARRRAVQNAKELAKELSDDADVSLGDIEEIRYHVKDGRGRDPYLLAYCGDLDEGDPIAPTIAIKDLEYTDTVTMSWSIKQ